MDLWTIHIWGHSLPPSAYATVKAYSNFDADRDAAALEAAIKTKGEEPGLCPKVVQTVAKSALFFFS
uniref:Uncharacterized protein n=1 Tax=Pavo cristatus TaxID=9049 RepID=A0A8C9FQD5_PAVCR